MAAPSTDPLVDARAELEARIRRGRLRSADDLRDDFPAAWADLESRLELVYAEYVLRVANGEQPSRDDCFARYPELHGRLERLFGLYDLMSGGDTHHPAATVGDARPVPTSPADSAHPAGYEVLEQIGRGGMAVVYQARQIALNRVVAVKVLRGGGWFRDDDTARIRREAEAVARMQHPHIVQIHEVGEWDGVPFLALEYVPGGTLADALAASQRQGTVGIPAAVAVGLIETLARATQYAHEQGVIHRDLKPANVLLADDPAGPFARPKITDFGLAVSTELSAAVSQSAMLAGTPCYMAPEQANSQTKKVGPRTDVYALGGILYELLTGRPPFQGATVLETLDLVRHADPVRPQLHRPQVPRDLETICLKCLEKNPVRRYDSAAALADDLARFRDGRPITARPVGAGERAWKWCRRRPLVAGMLCGLLVAVLVAVVLPSVFWRQAEDGRVREAGLRQVAEEREAKTLLKTARIQWLDSDLYGARESLAACDEAHRNVEWKYLWRATRPPVFELVPNPQQVGGGFNTAQAIAFSPDGSSLAAQLVSADTGIREVRTWDTAAGRPALGRKLNTDRVTELLHPSSTEAVVVCDSSTLLQIGSRRKFNYTVDSFDLTGIARARLCGTTLGQLQITPNRRYAVCEVYGDGTQSVIDVTSGIELYKLTVKSVKGSLDVLFSGDSRRVAIGGRGQSVYLFDLATGQAVGAVSSPVINNLSTSAVALSPDGSRVAFRTHQVVQPNRLVLRDMNDPPDEVVVPTPIYNFRKVRFSPDGRFIAAIGNEQGFAGVWDAHTGREFLTLRGHRSQVTCFAFSPDSQRMAVGDAGGRVAIWDITADGP